MEPTSAEIRTWISERLEQEEQTVADTAQPDSARDAAHGAVAALEALMDEA